MRIATVSLNQTPLDWNRNADQIRTAIQWVRSRETMVVCFPELCLSGIGCGPHFNRTEVRDRSLDLLLELLPDLKGMIATLGLPIEYEGHLFNAVCLIVDGKPFGFQCKTRFAPDELNQYAWFRPWARNYHVPYLLQGESYKFGDISVEFKLNDTKTFHVAVEIGEPDWAKLIKHGPSIPERNKLDLLFNPSAARFSLGQYQLRLDWAQQATKEHDYIHVFSNPVGNESGAVIYEGGSFIAQSGKILARTPRFSWYDVQCNLAELGEENATEIEPDSLNEKDELTKALSMGTLDYLQKSGAQGFALSLSGGADSAAVACIVALGIRFAWAELGREGFLKKFAHIRDLEQAQTVTEVIHRLLLCFYQAAQNSSTQTQDAAQKLASELGAGYRSWDIQPIVDLYNSIASNALGRTLTWQQDDVTLQNIQARSRAPSAWLLANAENRILLATGNRSEAMLGYTTMDGDTAGALAPVGGLDKATLREWLQWLETTGPLIEKERFPFPFLSVINSLTPTAELKPIEMNQSDESELMPYPLLNRIEQLGPVQGKTKTEIIAVLTEEFKEYTPEQIQLWTDRFFQLWYKNQWKRHRYALTFDIDSTTHPTSTWRDYPALTGRD